MTREPVPATPRKGMTDARKRRAHVKAGGRCWLCSRPVPMFGAEVQYDHTIPLHHGGQDSDDNLTPLHASPCHKIKTARDAKDSAKIRRIQAAENGTRRERKAILSRGFPMNITRGFDGKVRPRSFTNAVRELEE